MHVIFTQILYFSSEKTKDTIFAKIVLLLMKWLTFNKFSDWYSLRVFPTIINLKVCLHICIVPLKYYDYSLQISWFFSFFVASFTSFKAKYINLSFIFLCSSISSFLLDSFVTKILSNIVPLKCHNYFYCMFISLFSVFRCLITLKISLC